MKIILGDLNTKMGRKNIFKTTISIIANFSIVMIMVLE
jgi:hypothetical protein